MLFRSTLLEKTVTYLYDANGNEIAQRTEYLRPHNRNLRRTTGGNAHGDTVTGDVQTVIEKVTNTYDGFNRLRTTERIRAGERVVVSFLYDGDGLRTEKRERSSKDDYAERVTRYTYDRQYVILETDGANKPSKRYVRGINYIASVDKTERLAYFLFNGHGDVVHTVSESGAIENRYDYDVFGSPILSIELYANEIRYAGEFFDVSTGLYYLRARYYNPHTGRFITEDT